MSMTDEKRDEGAPAPANDSVAPAETAGQAPGVDLLEEARAEAARLKDQLLRALAETENVRRRGQREREDAQRYAASNFAKDMLAVADNLGRALQHIPAEQLDSDPALKTLYDGVAATERQLLSAFERHNIKRIEPLGEKFDSNLHQAMFEVPGTGQPAGTIVQVLQPGYVMHDRLLRAAMVGVAKAEPAGTRPNGEGTQPGSRIDTVA
ncbi:protein GrpE [Hypericibacter terrae]|uniref:Protein GrpE n=2 Tax=Hypericibacter terrae TaxID=2602015 RepID=A0A5J6MQ73_9PROT|nr:protein GrpE [Hypericibacter terrae]